MAYDPAKEAKKQAKKSAERYEQQAKDLQGQLDAQALAVNTKLRQALDARFSNIQLTLSQADSDVVKGYTERTESLTSAARDNAKAADEKGVDAKMNRARERTAALQQAYMNGAGESDVMRTSLMATRNWQANQGEVMRSQFDTLRTINQSQSDLNIDTRTARINAVIKANADRDAAYTDYANRMSEAYTQMGNIATQQAELYGLAYEQRDKGSYKDRRKSNTAAANSYFTNAANWAGAVYTNPGVSDSLRNWEDQGEREQTNNASRLASTADTAPVATKKKPEGSSLRDWDEEVKV